MFPWRTKSFPGYPRFTEDAERPKGYDSWPFVFGTTTDLESDSHALSFQQESQFSYSIGRTIQKDWSFAHLTKSIQQFIPVQHQLWRQNTQTVPRSSKSMKSLFVFSRVTVIIQCCLINDLLVLSFPHSDRRTIILCRIYEKLIEQWRAQLFFIQQTYLMWLTLFFFFKADSRQKICAVKSGESARFLEVLFAFRVWYYRMGQVYQLIASEKLTYLLFLSCQVVF